MQLLGLLIYTIVFIVANASMVFFFLKMIQPNGALDVILGWQKFLDYAYDHKYTAVKFLGKALGGCEMCTCFWFSGLSFFIYRWLAIHLNLYTIDGWYMVIWYWVYWGLSAFYSYWFNKKMSDNGL